MKIMNLQLHHFITQCQQKINWPPTNLIPKTMRKLEEKKNLCLEFLSWGSNSY